MPCNRFACLVLLLVAWAANGHAHEPEPRNTLVPPGHRFYTPGPAPDRIIATLTEQPARSFAVSWRTTPAVAESVAQITRATASAGLHLDAVTVTGRHRDLGSDNGLARHHNLVFENLEPDTLYAYRVRGLDTWSEWFQIRTPHENGGEFSFLYFGDAQNSVKSHFSRVIREAHQELQRPALMLHAGDLVNLRAGVHDDEWGEWFEAGAFLYASTPNIPVAGNHEFVNVPDAAGNNERVLSEHFRAQFEVPPNGPAELSDTVYFSRYRDVLFVALDSTIALEDEAMAILQAEWLESLLAEDQSRWRIISHHHPMFSVSLGRDNPLLREHWQPIYDRHGVDLVLQGHDHTYGRGDNVPEGAHVYDDEVGTVYMVSVAGPKMYRVAPEREAHRRVGEDVQLFQIVHVSHDRLRVEARTAIGDVYDAFDLERSGERRNRLIERADLQFEEAECRNPSPSRDTRCWEGTELVD